MQETAATLVATLVFDSQEDASAEAVPRLNESGDRSLHKEHYYGSQVASECNQAYPDLQDRPVAS